MMGGVVKHFIQALKPVKLSHRWYPHVLSISPDIHVNISTIESFSHLFMIIFKIV